MRKRLNAIGVHNLANHVGPFASWVRWVFQFQGAQAVSEISPAVGLLRTSPHWGRSVTQRSWLSLQGSRGLQPRSHLGQSDSALAARRPTRTLRPTNPCARTHGFYRLFYRIYSSRSLDPLTFRVSCFARLENEDKMFRFLRVA